MKRKTTLSLLILFFFLFAWQSEANALTTHPFTEDITMAPPSNDDCANAISLTVNPNFLCTNTTAGTVVDATASVADNSCTVALPGAADDDVWFKFVATDTDHRIELLNIVSTNSSGEDLYQVIYDGGASGVCSPTDLPIFCSDPETSNPTGLTIGNTYFIRVFTKATTVEDTTFDICVGTAAVVPSNDDCANAEALTLPVNSSYDANGATNNAGFITATGCIDMNDGVWFTVMGDGGDITVTVSPTNWDAGITVYEGSCGTFTCVDDSNIGTSGVIEAVTFASTLGTTYYINVGFPSGTVDGAEGVFGLDVNSSTLSIDEIIAKGFSYYPNPVKDILKMRANETITQISLYSVIGREIKRITKADLDVELDFGSLPPGTYYVRAIVGDKSGSFKVIKEKYSYKNIMNRGFQF